MSRAHSLQSVDVGRDNNLNLIRFCAAAAVIFSHSYRVLTGEPGQDPVAKLTGLVPANLAVDVFFLISGYLVTKSLFSRGSIGNFILARTLRLIPALLVCTALTAFVLGPIFTDWPLLDYFKSGKPYNYVFQNVILLSFATIPLGLPGVFEHLPEKLVVNGSLWTLPFEAWMYISLAGLGVVGLIRKRGLILIGMLVCLTAYFINELADLTTNGLIDGLLRFCAFFYAGTCFFLYRQKIPISGSIFFVLAVVAAGSFVFGLQTVAVPIALAYGTFAFAFLVKGPILAFNKLGDFSYGLYIYAWPIQQSLIVVYPTLHPATLSLIAFVATLAPAVASWFMIEKPALALKDARVQPIDN